uniref:Uncharacterized protein n=1 Tax=Romanomermis culicivorax TaxID=13658 RepID=A0A915J4L8_ROMCU
MITFVEKRLIFDAFSIFNRHKAAPERIQSETFTSKAASLNSVLMDEPVCSQSSLTLETMDYSPMKSHS